MNNEELKAIALKIKETIEQYACIAIVRHERPDCDAHGSALGLKYILEANYPDKDIRYIAKEAVDYPSFMGREDKIESPDDITFYQKALCIALDTANKERVSSDYFQNSLAIIKIDHHPATDAFGSINYVDSAMPACAAILCRLAKIWNYTIPEKAMEPLYVGMVMDTGRFRYPGTNGEVMNYAGELIDKGHLDLERIYAKISLKELHLVHLSGYVTHHFKQTKNGVSYFIFTQENQNKFNASMDDCASLVNNMDSIKRSEMWLLFIETPQEVRISLRSRFVDITPLAQAFNGGGHKNACGARVKDKTMIKEVLKQADKYLKEYHLSHPESE